MFAEDHSVFFDVATGFAVNATYQDQTIQVILDSTYLGIDHGGVVVDATDLRALARLSQVETIAQGHMLSIEDKVYEVVGVEPDGTGLVVLRLERQ